MCAKPVVITKDQKLIIGDEVLASSLYSVFDAEGDPITQVRFRDVNGSENLGGAFYIDGVQVTDSNWFTVDAADLAKVYFHAAAGLYTEEIQVQLYDGTAWSNIGSIDVYTGTFNNLGPTLTVAQGSVIENEILDLHSIIAYSDVNNDPVVRYKAKDNRDNTGSSSGYFVKNGVRQLQTEWFYFTASDNVYYVAAPGLYQEGIQVRAFDGIYWTDPVNSSIKTYRNANRPVAASLDVAIAAGTATPITDLFQAYDEDLNSLKTYSFRDTHNLGGYLMYNDQVVQSKTWLTVTADQLENVYFVAADRTFYETLFVQVNDGKYNSNIGSVLLESVAVPVLAVENTLYDDLESAVVGPLISKIDQGPAYTKYEVISTSAANSTSYFTSGGIRLVEDQVYEMSIAQLNNLRFRSGVYEYPSRSDLLVRASNGTFWSDWTRVQFDTRAEHYTGMINGYNGVTGLNWGMFLPPNPTVITYSFFNIYEPGYEGADVNADNFVGFNTEMRASAREWLTEMESFANVEFVEVAADSISPYGNYGGEIRFGSFYLEDTLYYAFAYSPADPAEEPLGGDIWINHWATANFQPGQFGYTALGKYLGVAMGLKDSRSAPSPVPGILNNGWNTVMGSPGRTAEDYGTYDVLALQKLYGANENYNSGNNIYSFGESPEIQMKTIWDTGGEDTLDLSGFTRQMQVDIREGGSTQVLGVSGFTDQLTGAPLDSDNINISYGTTIENVIAGDQDDIIIGNNVANRLEGRLGDDWIRGLGGNDLLMAGGGDDTYVWGLGDGHDTINEQLMAGRDMLIIETELAGLDDFSADISFSRHNQRDLLIDLTLDGGQSVGSIYIEYQQGSSRIETLRLAGYNGADLDLDLTTFIASLDSNPTSMVLTGGSSVFGSIIAAA